MTIPSPCNKICVIAPSSGFCVGCGRTGDEIAGWAAASAGARQAVMAVLPERLSRIGADQPGTADRVIRHA